MEKSKKEIESTMGMRLVRIGVYPSTAYSITNGRVHHYLEQENNHDHYWDTKRNDWITEEQYKRIAKKETNRLADNPIFLERSRNLRLFMS